MPIGKIIVWLIVGALAGSFTGLLFTGKKEGWGRWTNLGMGLAGALIGGLLFHVFKIDLGLGDLGVRFEDLIAAVVGTLILLVVGWLIRKSRSKEK